MIQDDGASDHDPIAILRAGVAAAIPNLPSPDMVVTKSTIDWPEVERLGRASKLLVQAAQGFARLGWTPDAGFAQSVADYRKAIFSMNSLNLASTKQVAAALANRGIDFILFKGPIGQKNNYGDYFIRPSSDVDILVSRKDIASCANVLKDIGYYLPAECDRLWWTAFLGEQHFFAKEHPRATVDLHHRLQQPGCPQPRNVAAFMMDPQWHAVGDQEVPTISRINAALLASMSFVKSLVQHCHSATYLADFCAATLALDDDERGELLRRARRQNIENMLRLTIDCATRIYGMVGLEGQLLAPSAIDDLFGDQLAKAIFAPELADIRWPRLRRLLWPLCDDPALGRRMATYSWVGGSFLASKIARRCRLAV